MKNNSTIQSKIKALQTYLILEKEKFIIEINQSKNVDCIFNTKFGSYLVLTSKEYLSSDFILLKFFRIDIGKENYFIYKVTI